ncbi:MAG: HAD-IA family hydrolase [Burkholderiales bacterium]|nr:HAD-IA family hydrolase [Burkholderiales bacterium]
MRRSLPVPRAVLFDLDGTLADTAPDLANAVNKMRQDRGLPLTPYELLRPMASAGARGLIGVAFGIQPGDADFEPMRTEFLANYEAQIADQTVLFEDVVALLAKIESNDQHWGIVTNKPLRYTDALLPLIGLAHAACSISGDTTPHAKPHPEPLFEAARRLQLAPEQCWYVGDDLRDIQAGKAAGMPTIAAGWGYCGMSEPANWDADFIAGSPREIIELLSGT